MNENMKYETAQRTETLIIRLTLEEKKRLFISAQQAGISISAFVRMLMHKYSVMLKEK